MVVDEANNVYITSVADVVITWAESPIDATDDKV
jgi:hypothetical protein